MQGSLDPLEQVQGLERRLVLGVDCGEIQPDGQLLSQANGQSGLLGQGFIDSHQTKVGVLGVMTEMCMHQTRVEHLGQDGGAFWRQSLGHGADQDVSLGLRQNPLLLNRMTELQGLGQVQSTQETLGVNIAGNFDHVASQGL